MKKDRETIAGGRMNCGRMCLALLAMLLLPTFAFCGTEAAARTTSGESLTLVESIDLRRGAFLMLADQGYTSTQGMCVINDRYLVIARYKTDGSRDLAVYDVLKKEIVASNVFKKRNPEIPDSGTNVDLEHCNAITYWDGYLYIPRFANKHDIVRLKFCDDCSIIYDSVAYMAGEGEAAPLDIACHNGIFYLTTAGRRGRGFDIYRSTDGLNSLEYAFSSDFGGLVNTRSIVKQGLSFDGTYLYFPFTGVLNALFMPERRDTQNLKRSMERIIVTKTDGEIVREFSFSRGNYGEIEDVDILTLRGNTSLIISCNRNGNNVACVYAVPLFQNTVSSAYLEGTGIDGRLYSESGDLEVFCDNRTCYENGVYDPLQSRPFATGLEEDPFTDVYAAIHYIEKSACAATLYLRGNYGELSFDNLGAGLRIVLDGANVRSMQISRCPEITLEGKNDPVLGHLGAEKSVVLVAPGIHMIQTGDGNDCAIEVRYGILTGSFEEIAGYVSRCQEDFSIVNIS